VALVEFAIIVFIEFELVLVLGILLLTQPIKYKTELSAKQNMIILPGILAFIIYCLK
jgi:hypothetical protein